MSREQRRLAAIVAADVVGYSRLMGRDESGTLAALKALRREVVDPPIAAHGGRIVKTTGDGLLLEFPSVVDAMRCVVEIQTAMAAKMADVSEDRRIVFRIGLHVGDIIIDDDDIFGDGVNIAARLQEIASPGGVCVSGRVHDDVRDRLDTLFEDGGAQTLKNIARPVPVWRWSPGAAMSRADAPLALPDKPSIAVLPFQNMSGDPEQEYFTDGMTEDIITELSRFRDLFVIARNSTFTYKGKAIDVRQVAGELGVHYLLEGSIRKAGNRIRVTGQLIDAVTGGHLWAERYDRELSDIFAVQEEITRTIVGSIAPAIEDSALASVRRVLPANLNAYEIAVRAFSEANNAYLSGDPVMRERATASAQRALTLDPACVRAWLALAFARWQAEFYSGRDSTPETCGPGLEAARRAIELDRLEHRAYTARGLLHLQLARYDDALADLRQACELNPNDALALTSLAYGEVMYGDGPAAKAHLLQALRLSPRDPWRYNACAVLGNACFLTEEYAEGLNWIAESRREHPNFPPAIAIGIRLYVGLGQMDRAKAEAYLLRRLRPQAEERAKASASLFRRPEDRERSLRLLRAAFDALDEVASKTETPPLPLPDKPSIAVLPFQNMSGDPEQEYFADGMVEDIITALSRFKSLFVIARNSSFTYKGRAVDIKQVGRELGVRYVLEGSVRKAGSRVRITGQLVEAASNAHLWADRFEGSMDDIFALQDKVTSSVVGIIDSTIQQSEIQRALLKPTGNLNAYDCYLRGVPKYNKWTREANEEAHSLFSAALELDPHYAAALIQLAYVHAQRWMQGWTDDRQREIIDGKRLQERALELAKEDQFVLASSAYLHIQFGGDVATAVSLIDRAMNLNPNSSWTLETSTWIRIRAGEPELAIEHCLRAMRLNPLTQTNTPLAIAYFLLGREQEALAGIDEALINAPRALPTLRFAAIIKVGFGRVEEARQLVKRILEISPNARFGPGIWTTADKPEYKRKWTEALRSLVQLAHPE